MIIKNVNINKLHQEFVSHGFYPHPVLVLGNGDGDFTFSKDVNLEIIQSIIDAHDPTPAPQPLSEIEKLRLEQAQANSELIQLIMMMGGA